MKNLFFPVEMKVSIGSIPSSGKLKFIEIDAQKMVKFYEVILFLLAKLNGLGMIICRMNRIAITPVKIDSSGNQGGMI